MLAIDVKNEPTITKLDERLLGKRILVVGLGKTGLSCVRFFAHYDVVVTVNDSRSQPPGIEDLNSYFPETTIITGGFEPEAFESAEVLVVNPGISLREPLIVEARARGALIIGDIELFAWHVDAPVIADRKSVV